MRRYLFSFWMAGLLGAQAPLHIVSVERRGLPPYESADRVYGLDGGRAQGLRVGDRLLVKRVGEVRPIGHLWVTELRGERAETRFAPLGTIYPMKGDLALLEVMRWPPVVARVDAEPLGIVPAPGARTEAPPREGLIFFLPQQAEVSPAGVQKLERWVEAWGTGGRWAVQVPSARALKPALQKQRAESLRAALRALGIDQVAIELEPRTVEAKYDPAWIRHWE